MNMPKRPFGRSGEELSPLGFGCMRLPWKGANASFIDEPRATELIHRAIEGGVNYFDTAWPYHGVKGVMEPGQSEPFLGRALQGGWREKIKLATKLPVWLMNEKADLDGLLNAQLERLRVEQIDFYLAHGLDVGGWERVKSLNILEFFHSAQKDGRIKHIGFSFHDEFALFEEIINAYDWEFTQIQYNYLDRDYQAGQKGLKLAYEKGLATVIMGPLRGGALASDLPPEAAGLLRRIRPEWSLAEWGLKWLWNQPEVNVVLSGMNEMTQLEENIRLAAESGPGLLNQHEIQAVEQVQKCFEARAKVRCTGCGYCLPCPEGVDIPKNFIFYNKFHLLDSDVARRQSFFFYQGQITGAKRADSCVGCGQCETKCPQHLPIAELMPEVAATFALS